MYICQKNNIGLKRFEQHQLIYNQHQTWQVLQYFFDGRITCQPSWMGEHERGYAQALMVEALDASAKMIWIQRLFSGGMVTPSFSILSLATQTLKEGAKLGWFKFIPFKMLQGNPNPVIFHSVKAFIFSKQTPIWSQRVKDINPVTKPSMEIHETLPFYCK